MRDLEKQPYSPDEQRVAQFFFDAGLGGGDDPIGFIIASHQALAAERNALRSPITMPDIRLAVGEGKLSAHDVLVAANAVLRMRSR